jgi:SNF2 family DNA or RNA helicase
MLRAHRKSVGVNAHLPPSSTKIRKILELLGDIEDRGEGEKTIIFSQFTSMLDLIEPFLKAEQIKYVRCK